MKLNINGATGAAFLIIEPYWNVNTLMDVVEGLVSGLIIEPYWNVNTPWVPSSTNISKLDNRTILECKSKMFYQQ
ncbi:MAG: hypothetical protein PWR12_889 [Eubacteriaceae bacterium]|nr:hypothetical protein [Eubacteriaceae bacterium]